MDRAPFGLLAAGLVLIVCATAQALPPKPTVVENPTLEGKKLDEWLADLGSKDPAVRRAALGAIETLPVALKEMKKKDTYSEVILDKKQSDSLFGALLGCLKDEDKTVRVGAAKLLLDKNEYGQRWRSNEGQKTKDLPVLLEALKDTEPAVRTTAVTLLEYVSTDEKVVLVPLTGLLKDPDAQVRRVAVRALGGMVPRVAAVPALIGALDDEEPTVRNSAVSWLGVIGAPAEKAAPKLLTLLREDKAVRYEAARALGRIREAKLTVPALTEALKGGDTRWVAAMGLVEFGPGAKTALPALLKTFNDSAGSDRAMVLRAIFAIDPSAEGAQTCLLTALKDAGPARDAAIGICQSQGAKAKACAPSLLEAFKDSVGETRAAAIQALFAVDPDSDAAQTSLLTAIKAGPLPKDKDATGGVVWRTALRICKTSGPKARAAVPVVLDLVKGDISFHQRYGLLDALAALKPDAKDAVPTLIEVFKKTKSSDNRQQIASIFKSFGPDAKAAVPVLLEVLKEATRDGDDDLEVEIFSALRKIDPDSLKKPKKL